MNLPQIRLKKNKDTSVKRFHPWIFSGAIQQIPEEISEGNIVEVLDNKGNFLGIGHYQPDSIAVRMLTFRKEAIDVNFFRQRFLNCYALRKNLQFEANKTNVFRLVHGEGDGLPGLIIDYYNGVLVVQCHSAGMFRSLNLITEALVEIFKYNIKAIYNKSASTLPAKYEHHSTDGFLWQASDNPIEVMENGHRFLIDFINGQKTGFFIDQREHRKLLSSFSAQKRVANLYGYTGGFAIYAAKAGAIEVLNVDSSEKALIIAEQNYQLNHLKNIRNTVADVSDFLKTNSEMFDIIILDPPAFAKHRKHKTTALRAYKQINARAMKKISTGGLLFSFSCSQAISAIELRQAIFVAAASENKNVRILYQLHQPADHPISIFHPEGEYLKGFVLQVE